MKYSQKLQPGWVRFSRSVRMSSSKRPRFLVKDMRRRVRSLSSREFQDSWDRDESFRGSDSTTHLRQRGNNLYKLREGWLNMVSYIQRVLIMLPAVRTYKNGSNKSICYQFSWSSPKIHQNQLVYRGGVFSPVVLLVAKIAADLVHDGWPRQDVGLVLLLSVVGLHDDDDPVCWAMSSQAVLPAHHVLLHRALIHLCVLQWSYKIIGKIK